MVWVVHYFPDVAVDLFDAIQMHRQTTEIENPFPSDDPMVGRFTVAVTDSPSCRLRRSPQQMLAEERQHLLPGISRRRRIVDFGVCIVEEGMIGIVADNLDR